MDSPSPATATVCKTPAAAAAAAQMSQVCQQSDVRSCHTAATDHRQLLPPAAEQQKMTYGCQQLMQA
jgi:hypothetical protein